MFLRYIDFIFAPFRAIHNKILGIKTYKGNIQMDAMRLKSLGKRGQNAFGQAGQFNNKLNQAGQQGDQMQQAGQPGAAAPQAPNPNPPVITKGFWIFAKKFCSQCEQQLDKSWDQCPYCAQIAAQAIAAPAKAQALKTQAFVVDANGGPGSTQLLGWIVPLQGPQRGELITLSPISSVGTDPKSTVVLNDKFMSSKHAEIKAENGVWVLRDAGSTNGTYVNNRRVDRHELVDNDFIKFGSALLKFKSL
ncbi:MAG: FHA domain-containing protein [Myxococcales bacterium]|nr:FHA domain-containing protein [Myxococcales bacterium]